MEKGGSIIMIANGFQPVEPRCLGCGNIVTQTQFLEVPAVNLCRIYFNPEGRWSGGHCPMGTHVKKKVEMEAKALDPIKASKRAAKGR